MISLFISYAHEDEELRNVLEVHLAMLKRNGLVRAWHDRRITAGSDLDGSISEHLEEADVVLLLLSPHFLASDYCYETEAARALQLHEAGKAIVIPVILQPCDWLESPFRKLRATPKDGKPVAKFPNMNDAFLEVTRDIRDAAKTLGKSENPLPSASILGALKATPNTGPRSSNLRIKKTFTDRDRDHFLDECYAYVQNFFENSLAELRDRNPGIEFSFKKVTANGFTAAVYVAGAKRTSCHIWLPGKKAFGGDIAYAANDSDATNGVNDWMRIEDDGFRLGLKPSGMSMMRSSSDDLMTPQGAAEYFWSVFVSPLQ
jgi:hypothetical protein